MKGSCGYILLRLTLTFSLFIVMWVISSAETDKTCGIEIASHFCPGIRNVSTPCCVYNTSNTLKGFSSTTTEEEKAVNGLQTSLVSVDADASGGSTSETTIQEGRISGRTVTCIPPGHLLCYYREATLINGTWVCTPVIHEAIFNAKTCFKWNVCNGNVCLTTSAEDNGLNGEPEEDHEDNFKEWGWIILLVALMGLLVGCVCTFYKDSERQSQKLSHPAFE